MSSCLPNATLISSTACRRSIYFAVSAILFDKQRFVLVPEKERFSKDSPLLSA